MLFLEQLSLMEKLVDGCFNFPKAGVDHGLPGENDDIPTHLDLGDQQPDDFPNLTFTAVS